MVEDETKRKDDTAPYSPEEDVSLPENVHPADAADHLENLGVEVQVRVVTSLPPEEAAESIAEMERHDRTRLMNHLAPEQAAVILEQMSPDDAADILEELESELKTALLRRLGHEDRTEIQTLMSFDPDTAGGVMNTEIVVLDQGLTADQAIAHIRREIEDKEIPYYAYLVDEDEHLVGVLSLRDILTSKPGRILRDLIKDQQLVSVMFDVDKEEVARLISRYNLLAIPVIDHENRLLGVVTFDDVMDIIHEEASEDMQTMVGAGPDETVDSPWTYSVRRRLPWLILNVLNSAIAAWVVSLFEGTIAEMAILAVLMPIVANQAGNTGQQALAVMIRQLAMERFDRRKAWGAVLREVKIGLTNGLIVSSLVLITLYVLTANLALARVMAAALGLDMLVGALAGASIPIILKETGRDPAQASSIFLTTLTDSAGFFIFLGLASLLLL